MESQNDKNIIHLDENEEEKSAKGSVIQKNLFNRLKNIKSNQDLMTEYNNGYASLIGKKIKPGEFDKMSNAFIDRITQYNSNDVISKFKNFEINKGKLNSQLSKDEISKIVLTSFTVSDNKSTYKFLEKELDITKNISVEICNDVKPQCMLNHLIQCRFRRIQEGNYLGYKLSFFIYLLKYYNIDILDEVKKMFEEIQFNEIKIFEHIKELLELEASNKDKQLKTTLEKYEMTLDVYNTTKELYLAEYKPLQDIDVQWKLAQELLYLELFLVNDKRMTTTFLMNKRKEHKKLLISTQKIPEGLILNDFDYEPINIKAARNCFFGVNFDSENSTHQKKGRRTRNFVSLIIKALITMLRDIKSEDYIKKFIPLTIKLTLAKFEWFGMPFIKAMYMVNTILLNENQSNVRSIVILQEALKKLKSYNTGYQIYITFIEMLKLNPDMQIQLRYIAILYPTLYKEYDKQDLKNLAYDIFTIFRLKNCNDTYICNMIFSSKVRKIMKPDEAFAIWCASNDKPFDKLTISNLRLAIGNEFRKTKKQGVIPLAIQVLRNQHFGIFIKWDADILPKRTLRISESDFDPNYIQKWVGSFDDYTQGKKNDIINLNQPSNIYPVLVNRQGLIQTGVPSNIETKLIKRPNLNNSNLSVIQEEPNTEKMSRYKKSKVQDNTFNVSTNSLTDLVNKKKKVRNYSKIKYTK